jgi:tRNA G18 (ribose-2'-O)-methylase SpoU
MTETRLIVGDVGGIPVDQYKAGDNAKLVLVLGSESQGLAGFPAQLRRKADCISIATSGQMPFLNVAIAGSILMHGLR